MSKTKKRGGAKAHRKRVQSRNQKFHAEQKAFQKIMTEGMLKQIEELNKMNQTESGNTVNS